MITVKPLHRLRAAGSASVITAQHNCPRGYPINNYLCRHHLPSATVPACTQPLPTNTSSKPSPTTLRVVLPIIVLPGTTVAIKTHLSPSSPGTLSVTAWHQHLYRTLNPQRTQSSHLRSVHCDHSLMLLTPSPDRRAPGPPTPLPSPSPLGAVLGAPGCRGAGTLGRDRVLGAGGGGGLCAVAAGVLQRVPAALLVLQAQPPGQDHGQVAGGRGHLLPMLRRQEGTVSSLVPLLEASQKPNHLNARPAGGGTLAAIVAGDIRGLGVSSVPMPGYPLAGELISASRRCSTRSLRRCRVGTTGWS